MLGFGVFRIALRRKHFSRKMATTHNPPQRPQRIRWRNGAENGQRTVTCGPEATPRGKTTLRSGYGVDTFRWADNVRGTGPGEFQRGLTRKARERCRVGDISDAAPHLGLARHAQPGSILYTARWARDRAPGPDR
jgi:hypothetical protein